MPEQKLGWFYVGNGKLRYKDNSGWTDQYQDLDGPPVTDDVGPAGSPVAGADPREAVRRPVGHSLSPFARRGAAATRRLIAASCRLTVAAVRLLVAGLFRMVTACGPLIGAGWRLVAAQYVEVSASASRRAAARRPRHRGSLSASSVLRSQLRHAPLARPVGVPSDRRQQRQ